MSIITLSRGPVRRHGSGYNPGTSNLPTVLYDIDPALPSFGTSDPGSNPGIQLDANNKVQKVVLNDTARTVLLKNTSWNNCTFIPNGINGKPYLQGSTTNAYDNLTFADLTKCDAFAATLNQPYCFWFVIRTRVNAGGNDLIKIYQAGGAAHIQCFVDPATGAYTIGQNTFFDGTGSAGATESGAPTLNIWSIMAVTNDGDKTRLFRDGVKLAETSSETEWANFGTSGVSQFSILNNIAADLARLIICGNCPSNAQMNSEATRMLALYPAIVAQTTVTGGISSPTTFPAYAPDQSTAWVKVPFYPSSTTTPTDNTITIGHGLSLNSGAVNAANLIFGTVTGANVPDQNTLFKYCYSNPFVGDQTQAIGSPMDDPNVGTTFSRVRTYPVGNPYNLLKFGSFGIGLMASAGGVNRDQLTNGSIYCGGFRLQIPWRPGCVIKIRMQMPPGAHSWAVPWLFTGEQTTPVTVDHVWDGFGTTTALLRPSDTSGEYDINDGYSRIGETPTVPMGRQLNSAYVTSNEAVQHYVTSPSNLYRANSNGFKSYPSSGPPFVALTGSGAVANFATGFADFIFNWRDDGSNKQDYIIAPADDTQPALVYSTDYCEYLASNVTTTSGTHQVGMHLMLYANVQPTFQSASGISNNDGVTDGWTYFIQKIQGWVGGSITSPDSHRAD